MKSNMHLLRHNSLLNTRFLASIWLLLFIIQLLLASYLLPQFKPITDIMGLLPKEQHSPLLEKAQQQVNQQWQNLIIWLVEAEDAKSAVAHAKQLAQQLSETTFFSDTQLQWSAQQGNHFYRDLLPYRFTLLTAQDSALIQHDAADFIQHRLQLLYSPIAMQYASTLRIDPLFTFGNYQNTLQTAQQFDLFDDVVIFDHNHKKYALLLSKTRPLTFAEQQKLVTLHRQLTGKTIFATGMPLYAAYGAASAQQEISTVGSLSMLGVLLLMLLGFRSIMPLILAVISVGFGVIAAICACLIAFGEIHIITLAFGSSLIGITIDYSFHYFCDRLRPDCGTALDSLQNVFPGIALGISSSVLAYGVLIFTPFPALKQIGLFTVCGLLAAWLTVVLLFPFITQKLRFAKQVPFARFFMLYLTAWPTFCHRHRKLLLCIVSISIIIGLVRLTPLDDIRSMQKPAASLASQERLIRDIGQQQVDNQFFVVSAKNHDALLSAEKQLTNSLAALIKTQQISGYQALSSAIPSTEQQVQNWQLIDEKLVKTGLLSNALASLSMQPQAITQIEADFYQTKHNTFDINTWVNAAGQNWQTLWLGCNENHCSSIIRLSGIKDASVLTTLAALADNHAVFFVDSVGDINRLLQHYRYVAALFLVIGIVVITLFLTISVSFIQALRIALVPTLAILLTLASLSILGYSFSMFHLFGLLLALGIGMDYAIFNAVGKHPQTVSMAVFCALTTSLLAFGLLATSAKALIQAFGLSLGLGIFYAYLLAPLFNKS